MFDEKKILSPPPMQVIQLTPPGRGAVATLRVEGPGAIDAVRSRFHARNGRPWTADSIDRLVVGHFGGEEIVVRRSGDNAVELHCHGGHAAAAMIVESLVDAGCRPTTWQEWISGRHDDPIAAAAFKALAEARTERTAAILLDQYHGALHRAIDDIEHALDRGETQPARRQTETLLARLALGQHLTHPWSVVLAGRPNVGKSRLINTLAGYQRAIVHHAPGTTRDAVTVATAIDGWPVELCDTAGLRADGDVIERAGMERAKKRLGRADLVLLIADAGEPWSAEDQSLVDSWPEAVLVHNKCDLPPARGQRPAGLSISALRGDGIESLLEAIAQRLVPDPPPPGAAVPFTPEQAETVRRLSTSGT